MRQHETQRLGKWIKCAGLACGLLLAASPPALALDVTRQVSLTPSFQSGNAWSSRPAITKDGLAVAFLSAAANLVPNDTNGKVDVFVRNMVQGITWRASRPVTGGQANENSDFGLSVAQSGVVAFGSAATNLVPGGTDGVNVFVAQAGPGGVFSMQQVSVGPGGAQANGSSFGPRITPDGRFVAFVSYATNLVPNDTNGRPDVFVRDLWNGVTTRESVSSSRAEPAGLTPDENEDALFDELDISADGRYVIFSSAENGLAVGDTDGRLDLFWRDRQTGITKRVTVNSLLLPVGIRSIIGATISADGRYVAFGSSAPNLVPGDTNDYSDIFVRDMGAAGYPIARISVGPGGVQSNQGSFYPTISAGGRYVAFESNAGNLVAGDVNGWADVFRYDRATGQLKLISLGVLGNQGSNSSFSGDISSDGQHVAFMSDASNIALSDANGTQQDVFLRGPQPTDD